MMATLCTLAFTTACGGGDAGTTTPTPTPTPTGSFSLSVSATAPTTMVQTGAGSAIVTVSRTGSFSGAVSLSVEGAPSGVTVTPSSATVASGATTSTLAIDVSLNVPAGSYPLTIRGQATGQSAQSTTLTLTVVTSTFRTASGASVALGATTIVSGTSGLVRHLPAAPVQAGDFHTLVASATLTNGGNTVVRSATQTTASPTATTLTLGVVPGEPLVSPFETSAQRVRFMSMIAFQADYTRLYIAGWFQQLGATRRDVTMTVTEAMATITSGSDGTRSRLRVPDFSAAPGWNLLWESRPGLAATYLVSASGWTASGGLGAPLSDGVVTRSYTRIGPVP